MARTKAEIYLHFVWTTVERQPFVTRKIRRALYRCIEKEARDLGCVVLATGGIEDHVHSFLQMPTKRSPATVMQQLKGVSSTFARNNLMGGEPFGWQEGYAVFSVSRSHVAKVIAYINNQEKHHAEGPLWPVLEETAEDEPKAAEEPTSE